MRNLQELTGQESGIIIIIYDGRGILCNWNSINGFPRIFATNLIGFGEEVPEIEGEHTDNLSGLLKNINIDVCAHYTDDKLPETGTVYRVNDRITVIAPDDWA